MAVGNVGVDVHVQLDGSRSNGFRDIREVDFVSNERTIMTKPIQIERNAFQPKNEHVDAFWCLPGKW